MTETEAKLLAGLIALFVFAGIPIYNFFSARAAEKKAELDQVHARANEASKKIAHLEGERDGRAQAFAEMAVFIQLTQMANKQ